ENAKRVVNNLEPAVKQKMEQLGLRYGGYSEVRTFREDTLRLTENERRKLRDYVIASMNQQLSQSFSEDNYQKYSPQQQQEI
ncbi:hypothetical protein ABK046_49970, partial [Streptomyces caeruleatus]